MKWKVTLILCWSLASLFVAQASDLKESKTKILLIQVFEPDSIEKISFARVCINFKNKKEVENKPLCALSDSLGQLAFKVNHNDSFEVTINTIGYQSQLVINGNARYSADTLVVMFYLNAKSNSYSNDVHELYFHPISMQDSIDNNDQNSITLKENYNRYIIPISSVDKKLVSDGYGGYGVHIVIRGSRSSANNTSVDGLAVRKSWNATAYEQRNSSDLQKTTVQKLPTRSVNQIVAMTGGVKSVKGGISVRSGQISSSKPIIPNTARYQYYDENVFYNSVEKPVSTFSIDVDAASYTNARRFISERKRPPVESIRIEEFINYFDYNYAPPSQGVFAFHTELAECPWNNKNYLLKIGIKGKIQEENERKTSNFVFLIDVSGSMSLEVRLPLLIKGFISMVNHLKDDDLISIVTYSGNSSVLLSGVKGSEKDKIIKSISSLTAGGYTAGGEGLKTAYSLAEKYYIPDGNNRIILATDGDFNVGMTGLYDLETFVEFKRKSGIMLTTLGFGTDNYADDRLELLANKGNGAYFYIDSEKESKRVLSTKLSSMLFTIAKDVKLQLEFNPKKVLSYRLIGYENRKLEDQDFEIDSIDAGDLGEGHNVTAFYEIVPQPEENELSFDVLRYQLSGLVSDTEILDEWLHIKLRYKLPNESKSTLQNYFVTGNAVEFKEMNPDFQFAALVALAAQNMRRSAYTQNISNNYILKNLKRIPLELHQEDGIEFVSLFQKYSRL